MIATPIESQPEELECTGSRGLLVRWGRASARERGRPGPILDEGLPARESVRPAMKNLDRPRFRTHFGRLFLTLLTNRPLHFYQRCPARPRGTGRKTKQEKIARKQGCPWALSSKRRECIYDVEVAELSRALIDYLFERENTSIMFRSKIARK